MPQPERVRDLFRRIAPWYDFLNRLLSAGIDRRWRRQVVDAIRVDGVRSILDVACGTGDLTRELRRRADPEALVVGIDFCEPMLSFATRKQELIPGLAPFRLVAGDGLALPFPDRRFERVTIAFGVRNVADLDLCLAELFRVTAPCGMLGILEFSKPANRLFRWIYYLYFLHVLPRIGALFSGDREAYRYLPDTVLEFPDRNDLCSRLETVGFEEVRFTDLTCGIATLYIARRGGVQGRRVQPRNAGERGRGGA